MSLKSISGQLTRVFMVPVLALQVQSSTMQKNSTGLAPIIDVHASQDPKVKSNCTQIGSITTTKIPSSSDANLDIALVKKEIDGYLFFPFFSSYDIPQIASAMGFERHINRAPAGIVHIDSFGGDTRASEAFRKGMQKTDTPVYTVAFDNAISMAFMVLVNGQEGKRYVHEDTRLMIHEASLGSIHVSDLTSLDVVINNLQLFGNKPDPEVNRQIIDGTRQPNQTDEDILNIFRDGLTKTNEQTQAELVSVSSTDITEDCSDVLIRNKIDMFMSAEVALKLGFVDTIINKDGTLTVRSNDKRVPAAP